MKQEHDGRPWAALEWLIPTAVIFVFGKSYLETLGQKAAEDHYALAKSIGTKLWAKVFGSKKSVSLVIQTKDGAVKDSVFCMELSFRVRTAEGIDVTLLFWDGASVEDIEAAISMFLSLIGDDSRPSSLARAVSRLSEIMQSQRQIVSLNPSTKQLELVDWYMSSRTGTLTCFPIIGSDGKASG